jgi:simple sugar transport system permease protein
VSQQQIATEPASTPAPASRRSALGAAFSIAAVRQLALLPVILVLLVIGSQINGSFLTWENILTNILGSSTVLAVVTVAESLLIISGKFDLSLQSIVGVAPMVAAHLVLSKQDYGWGIGLSPVLGIVILLLIGGLVGVVNGLLVTRLRLNAFIVTLAMLILLQGVTLGVSNGQTMTELPAAFTFIGTTEPLGIRLDVWIAAAVFLAAGIFMRYNVVGREIYAIGGNVEAARAAGVKVERVLLGLFIVAGVLAALAGLMLTSQIYSVTANQGNNLIFTVFAAAVIGGIDLNGGRGRLAGAATGVVLLGVVQNILLVSQVPSYWVSAIYGGIILLSLMLGALTGSNQLDRLIQRLRGGTGGRAAVE